MFSGLSFFSEESGVPKALLNPSARLGAPRTIQPIRGASFVVRVEVRFAWSVLRPKGAADAHEDLTLMRVFAVSKTVKVSK